VDHTSADAVQAPASASSGESGGLHVVEWSCELVGTALLLLGGLSAVALDFGRGSPVAALVPSTSLRLLLTGTLFAGTGSLVAISPLGRRSGGHINPAVTLAFWLHRQVHRHDLAGYVAAQFAGAILGTALWRLLWGGIADSVAGGVTRPGSGIVPLAAVGIEAVMTAMLVLVILGFVSRRATMRWTPLATWITVAMLVWLGAPLTGTSLNPARSLGPALLALYPSALWVYFVGPPLGAAAAALLSVPLFGGRRPVTAKLYHDPGHPSVFLRQSVPSAPRRRASARPSAGE
jgi:aquaporin Z